MLLPTDNEYILLTFKTAVSFKVIFRIISAYLKFRTLLSSIGKKCFMDWWRLNYMERTHRTASVTKGHCISLWKRHCKLKYERERNTLIWVCFGSLGPGQIAIVEGKMNFTIKQCFRIMGTGQWAMTPEQVLYRMALEKRNQFLEWPFLNPTEMLWNDLKRAVHKMPEEYDRAKVCQKELLKFLLNHVKVWPTATESTWLRLLLGLKQLLIPRVLLLFPLHAFPLF